MSRVLIFEDDNSLRDSLQKILATQKNKFTVVGAFPNCEGIKNKIASLSPDIILMDMEMPVVDGLQGLYITKQNYPEVKVLMITYVEDDDRILDAIQLGTDGYMLKSELPFGLFDAVQVVFGGGAHLTPSIARKVLKLMATSRPPRPDYRLTDTELKVLELLVKGLKYQQVADTLSISINTVSTHIKHIYEKLQVHSKAEVVRKAIQERLVNI